MKTQPWQEGAVMTVTNETPLDENRGSSSLSPGRWTDDDRRRYFQVLGRITMESLTPRQVKRLNRINPSIVIILKELVN